MHAYRSHTCAALRASDVSARGAALRLGASRARPRRACCSSTCATITASRRSSPIPTAPAFATAETLRAEWVDPHRRQREGARRRAGQPKAADRRDRGLRPRDRGPEPRPRSCRCRSSAISDYPEETRLQLPLPRPAAREAAPQHHAALRRDPPRSAQRMIGAGLHGVPDADPDRVHPRRRARLPGALPAAPRQVLCAAAGAAAVQAALHGRGLRPLFPDRALLPRRGPARRPLARRVLPARRGDELRRAGGRVRRDRAGDAGRVRGVRRRPCGHADLPAHRLSRRDAEVRHRTSRTCATRSRCRSSPSTSAARASRSSPQILRAGRHRGPRHPGADAAAAAPSATG